VYIPAVVDRSDEIQAGEVGFEGVATPPMTLRADTLVSEAADRFHTVSRNYVNRRLAEENTTPVCRPSRGSDVCEITSDSIRIIVKNSRSYTTEQGERRRVGHCDGRARSGDR
jgi:hypothetical protein